jgi:hypothetical protein
MPCPALQIHALHRVLLMASLWIVMEFHAAKRFGICGVFRALPSPARRGAFYKTHSQKGIRIALLILVLTVFISQI